MKEIIIGIMLLFSLVLNAQGNNFTISFTGGESVAMKDFADENGGGADFGRNGNIGFEYHLTDKLSIGTSASFHLFRHSDEFKAEFMYNMPTGTTAELGKWYFTELFFSPKYILLGNEKVNLFGEGYAGVAFCNYPEITAEVDDVEIYKVNSAKTTTFTYGFGVGLAYSPGYNLHYIATAGIYPGLKPEYDLTDQDGNVVKYKQDQTYYRWNIGLSYSF